MIALPITPYEITVLAALVTSRSLFDARAMPRDEAYLRISFSCLHHLRGAPILPLLLLGRFDGGLVYQNVADPAPKQDSS